MLSIETGLVALWILLPALVPNSAAAVLGGGTPIDGGRTWRGARVLGDGKTWRGVVSGTVAGVSIAVLANAVNPLLSATTGVALPGIPLGVAVGLAGGAMLGDIGASFLKRRTGRARGAPFPLVDQLDFVVGAAVCAILVAPNWMLSTLTLPTVVVILVGTPLLHLSGNIAAYGVGIKAEPW